MGLHDPTVLNAIYHHTIGDGRSLYDHILYIADKIEPGRGYDVSRQRKAAEENLVRAAAMILAESKAYIFEKEGIHV
jgi:nicotinate-nucleotide adenylyltransferase